MAIAGGARGIGPQVAWNAVFAYTEALMGPLEEHREQNDDTAAARYDSRKNIGVLATVAREHVEELLAAKRAAIVAEGCEAALRRIDEELGHLPHHNRSHTQEVRRRIDGVLSAVLLAIPGRFPAHLRELGDIAASYHDVERGYGKGENESRSADAALEWMRKAGVDGQLLYGESDHAAVQAAIMATVPSIVEGKFEQPHLLRGYHTSDTALAVSAALALSDIAVGLLDGGEAFQHDGMLRFREKKGMLFQERLTEATMGGNPLTEEEKMRFKEEVLAWGKLQVAFAAHLESAYLEGVLSVFNGDEAMQQVIRACCAGNDKKNAVMHAQATLERWKAIDPLALAREMTFRDVPQTT